MRTSTKLPADASEARDDSSDEHADPGENDPRGDAATSLVDRTLAVLEAFQVGAESQTMSDLSRRTDIPLSTVYRIVQRLASWGALERDRDGAYRIGLRLWEIGAQAPRWAALRQSARAPMHHLADATECHVQLAIRDGHQLVSLERLDLRLRAPAGARIGRRYGLHSTALGLVLLAYAPAEVQRDVLASPLIRRTPYTYVDPDMLRRELSRIRACGHAISDRQATLDHIGAAAPIFSGSGDVIAALSVVCRRERARIAVMSSAVRTVAGNITSVLNRDPPAV
ncbi:MAG: IclR family transcriptional regulator [Pseudoclavibacter sp.]